MNSKFHFRWMWPCLIPIILKICQSIVYDGYVRLTKPFCLIWFPWLDIDFTIGPLVKIYPHDDWKFHLRWIRPCLIPIILKICTSIVYDACVSSTKSFRLIWYPWLDGEFTLGPLLKIYPRDDWKFHFRWIWPCFIPIILKICQSIVYDAYVRPSEPFCLIRFPW